MNIGIIGCGNISTAYLQLAPQFRHLDIVACSDLDDSAANRQADAFGIKAKSIESLLSDPDIDLVLNLTVPSAHTAVSTLILQADKHVYSEKPFVLSLEEGQALQKLAVQQGKRIGSAPDTFLGGAHQLARELIDTGRVGKIIGGSCHFMNHGMEDWHPNPDFFYQPGGGPMLDLGAYYISNLVQLIGPVKRLMAMSSMPFSERTIACEPRKGEIIAVDTPTSIHTLLEFCNGAHITLSLSWDVWQHEHNRTELYGTEATLHVPDPNFFGGELRLTTGTEEERIVPEHPFSTVNFEDNSGAIVANYRGAGLADMIDAITTGRAHRCDDKLALHVIDVMTSAVRSGDNHQAETIETTCKRPAALSADLAHLLLQDKS